MLQDALRYFVGETGIMASMAIACGTGNSVHTAMHGICNASGDEVKEHTLYDLASLTKLFTGLTIMKLREEGVIDLQRPVGDYAPQFINLHEMPVMDVLGFTTGLQTPGRIDNAPDVEEALHRLMHITPVPNGDGRAYSDMHSMILRFVAEGATGVPLYELMFRYILEPAGMAETYACVPDTRLQDIACCNGEHRIEKGRYIVRSDVLAGLPHDPKALLLQGRSEALCGHAGLFSTLPDMIRLCQAVLQEKVISRDSLYFMAVNRTGHRRADGGWTQHLGCQCYVKHPNQYDSEVPVYMGEHAIALSGFTGHHLSVDIEKGIFALYLGNRVMDRLSVLVPENGRTLEDYGLSASGQGTIVWPDGTKVRSSVDYVHQKDQHLHVEIARKLGL